MTRNELKEIIKECIEECGFIYNEGFSDYIELEVKNL